LNKKKFSKKKKYTLLSKLGTDGEGGDPLGEKELQNKTDVKEKKISRCKLNCVYSKFMACSC